MTAGVKYALTRSARRAIGARRPCASSTMRTICCNTVSRPTRVARNSKLPVRFTVAPTTSSPGPFSTGRLSPVSIDSSTAERPSVTTPSVGIFSPGRTRIVSPGASASTGTSSCRPSARTTRAVRARKPISFFMASVVRPFARASRSRPRSMSAMMTDAASK